MINEFSAMVCHIITITIILGLYSVKSTAMCDIQGVPKKQSPRENFIFSKGSMDLSQTFRMCM